MGTKQKFKFEEALQELKKILTEIESGNISIDQLSEQVSKASDLIVKCKAHLKKTEDQINHTLDSGD